eukprot:3387161-Rhodomonas_salina.1
MTAALDATRRIPRQERSLVLVLCPRAAGSLRGSAVPLVAQSNLKVPGPPPALPVRPIANAPRIANLNPTRSWPRRFPVTVAVNVVRIYECRTEE